jgi:hypothetical protein
VIYAKQFIHRTASVALGLIVTALMAGMAFSSCGCTAQDRREFAEGFRDQSIREAPAVVQEAAPVLGDKFYGEVGERIGTVVGDKVADALKAVAPPVPTNTEDRTVPNSIGVLMALLLANTIRGGIRKYQERNSELEGS